MFINKSHNVFGTYPIFIIFNTFKLILFLYLYLSYYFGSVKQIIIFYKQYKS